MRRFKVNRQWLKHYYGGEIPEETTPSYYLTPDVNCQAIDIKEALDGRQPINF